MPTNKLGSGQNHDSRTSHRPSCRTCYARNPCDSQVRREASGDDARESGIDRTCSRRIDTTPMRLPQAARRARQPRTNRCLRKWNASAVARGGSWRSRYPFHHTLNGFSMHPLVRCQSHFRPSANEEGAILRILTWRPAGRRLDSWRTVIFDLILARTKRRRSRLATSWMAGGRPSVWIRGCSTSWTVPRTRLPRLLPSPNPLQVRRYRRNPREKPPKSPRGRQLPLNPARRLRKNRRRPPTAKWACSSGSIFLRTKSCPNSAGWTVSRPRSHSRALRRKSSIVAIQNSNRRTGNSKLWSELSEARVLWNRALKPNWLQRFDHGIWPEAPIWTECRGNPV